MKKKIKKKCTLYYDFEIFVVPAIIDVINGLVFIIIYNIKCSPSSYTLRVSVYMCCTVAKSGGLVDIKIER